MITGKCWKVDDDPIMPYIPNNDNDRRQMLDKIGLSSFADLLQSIPPELRLQDKLKLPGPVGEMELLREIEAAAGENRGDLTIFAGGGVYDHFIPSAQWAVVNRPEFVTAYTPYQAEVSQGTLQVIYEFQTHICRLTGMDVANASMYDGASAAAEAASLALGKTGRSKIIVSETVNPLYLKVIETYLTGRSAEIVTIPNTGGITDFDGLQEAVDDNTAAVILSQPNFFGLLEDIEKAAEMVHRVGGLMIAAIDPIAAVLLKSPGDCMVDIVVGEGQPLGIPLNFGGPLLGFFAVKKALIRNLPGRLVARTEDADGRPGFVLTLQTREQHIRRDKATSNICTNQALCATMATVFMSLMGGTGLKRMALLSLEKSHDLYEKIRTLEGYEPYYKGDFVREFAVKTPLPAKELIDKGIAENGVLPGVNLGRFYAGMDDGLLVTVTEKRSREEIDILLNFLRGLS